MTKPEARHGPRSKARIHLVLSHVVAVAFIMMVLSAGGVIARSFGLIGIFFGTLSVFVMFATRKSDEWIASLWSAGANAGFIAAIAWLILLPMAEGFFDGLMDNESRQDLPAGLASYVAFGAFLIGFNLKRIRGY